MSPDRFQHPDLSSEMRLSALILAQLCLTMQVYARGSSSLLMLPELRKSLPLSSGSGSAEKLRLAMKMFTDAETALDWHFAQEEGRKAIMPILRAMTTEALAEVPGLVGAA